MWVLRARAPVVDRSRLKRLLIVKMSSIGDVVHAMPTACALRDAYPAARITWLVEGRFAQLVQGHPAVDATVIAPHFAGSAAHWLRGFSTTVRDLRRESYDIAIDLNGLLRSSVLALLSQAPLRIGAPLQREGSSIVSYGVPRISGQSHAVYENLAAAVFLGAKIEPVAFRLQPDPFAAGTIAQRLADSGAQAGAPLIVINPSASAIRKSWDVPKWAQVAGELCAEGCVVLIGGAEHASRHHQVKELAGAHLIDLTGQTSLKELVALLARCALHIAPDTGSAHIAAALGRPVVGLYGPTTPVRLAPWGQERRVVYSPSLDAIGPEQVIARGREALRAGA